MRGGIAAVLVGLLSCAGPQVRATTAAVSPGASTHLENLRRAAQYPWTDDGACVVRESWGDWRTLVERCYFALDHSRMRFQDVDHRCLVAQVDAMTVKEVVAVCILVQPELVVGAIIVIGVVIVASAIAAEIAKEQATKPCWCTCLGRPDPNWNPGDKDWGKRNPGWRPYPAECRAACKLNGFSNSQCR